MTIYLQAGAMCALISITHILFPDRIDSSRYYRPVQNDTKSTIASKINALFTSIMSSIWPAAARYLNPQTKIVPPEHPVTNPYPRKFKHEPWPSYLDCSWQAKFSSWVTDSDVVLAEPKEGVTPLHVACAGGNTVGMSRSLALGLSKDCQDLRGQTPAYWAAYYGSITALGLISRFGVNLDQVDKRGKTPLRAAIKYGHTDAVAFFLSHNVSLKTKDGRGLTPLHLAAYRGHIAIYTMLALAGADETIRDPAGRTPREVLTQKYEERYKNSWFFMKPFLPKTAPALPLQPYVMDKLQQLQNK